MKGEKRKKRVEIKKSETKKKDENQERKIQTLFMRGREREREWSD